MIDRDYSISKPEDLIGKTWNCHYPGCGKTEEVTKNGIRHIAKKHFFNLSLQDLYDEQIALQEMERAERKIWFSGTDGC
jgi:hypothetical protein